MWLSRELARIYCVFPPEEMRRRRNLNEKSIFLSLAWPLKSFFSPLLQHFHLPYIALRWLRNVCLENINYKVGAKEIFTAWSPRGLEWEWARRARSKFQLFRVRWDSWRGVNWRVATLGSEQLLISVEHSLGLARLTFRGILMMLQRQKVMLSSGCRHRLDSLHN